MRAGKAGALGALGLFGALHLPCLVGTIGAAFGVGGVALWCGHQSAEASKDFGLKMPRLDKLPEAESRRSYPNETSMAATQLLLEVQPAFKDVIAAKTKDTGGAPVQTVFFKDDQANINVVVCLNGAMCPCSEPQAYRVGKLSDLSQPEKFPGQHRILEALAK